MTETAHMKTYAGTGHKKKKRRLKKAASNAKDYRVKSPVSNH